MGSDPQRKALFRGDGRSPSKLRAVVRRRLYSFSVAAITNYCKLSGLKQHKRVILQTTGLAGRRSQYQQGLSGGSRGESSGF